MTGNRAGTNSVQQCHVLDGTPRTFLAGLSLVCDTINLFYVKFECKGIQHYLEILTSSRDLLTTIY